MKFGLILGLTLGMIGGALIVKNSSCACDVVSKAQHAVVDKFNHMTHKVKEVSKNVGESISESIAE